MRRLPTIRMVSTSVHCNRVVNTAGIFSRFDSRPRGPSAFRRVRQTTRSRYGLFGGLLRHLAENVPPRRRHRVILIDRVRRSI